MFCYFKILTFVSAFASDFNIVSVVMLTLTQRMGTIASIIFENANADIDAMCEWAFNLHRGIVVITK